MNEFEYLVIGRDRKDNNRPIILSRKAFDTREEAMAYAFKAPSIMDVQIVAIVRYPARSWVEGPYPSCLTPLLCREKGYCRRDPACDD